MGGGGRTSIFLFLIFFAKYSVRDCLGTIFIQGLGKSKKQVPYTCKWPCGALNRQRNDIKALRSTKQNKT